MNKKLLWTLVVPAALASCSQDDLISEGISNTPEGKAISGVTFTIAKNGSEADTRAEWVNNKLSFEKGDLISLFWLGEDGYTQNNTNGSFGGSVTTLTDATAVTGKSNAIFRTEDGASFAAEAVVYEGYNLLVYPGNTSHVDPKEVVVSLPEEQKADEDFTKNVIYVGDSILHIHQPAYNETTKKYYNLYGEVASTDDPNTSGYAHGIKTGVKLLSSLLNMEFRIINTSAKDVKIEKVVLTTQNGTDKIYSIEGNLIPKGPVTTVASANAALGAKTQYRNPWYKGTSTGEATEVTLNCENIETDMAGTKVTMLLLPANITDLTGTKQPVLKVYTNYGMVQIGGDATATSTQSNCIYKANGVDYAAASDNAALKEIVENTANYEVEVEVPSTDNSKATYTFNSGVSMTRVINVDMQQANIQNQVVSNTEELNAILNAAVSSSKTYSSSGTKLNVVLKGDEDGNFELTNYDGLDAFVKKFGAGALALNHSTNSVTNVIVNTTEATELQNIDGLNASVTLTIPATSKISGVKNGTATSKYTITNPIINESVITVPAYAEITLSNNTDGTVHYTDGATITVTSLTDDTYGIIDYTATSAQNLASALTAGVNHVTLKNITSGFFGGDVDASSAPAQSKGGVTVTFDNCGDLSENIGDVKADVIVLANGTTYPDLTNATVTEIVVESETAVLGMAGNSPKNMTSATIVVKAGSTTEIDNLQLGTLEVEAGATANVGTKAEAPTNFYVFGTVSFAGSNKQSDEKVYTLNQKNEISAISAITGNCLVTGSLELKNDLAYTNVAVNETTAITVAEGVTGLGYTTKIFVTKDAQAKGTANLKFLEVGYNASKISWNGDVEDIVW